MTFTAAHKAIYPLHWQREESGDVIATVTGMYYPNTIATSGTTISPTWATDDCIRDMLESYDRDMAGLLETKLSLGDMYMQMLNDLKNVKLDTCDLDALIMLKACANLFSEEYNVARLEFPEWFPKRQQAIARAIPAKLQEEAAKLQGEADELRSKEEKRKALEARAKKLLEASKVQGA